MIGNKANSAVKPTAFGLMLGSSVYGSAIASIYGRTRVPLQLIWNANLRQGQSGKKGKKSTKKGSPPSWFEAVDFLIGSNPILSPLQVWDNASTKYPLNFVKWTGSAPFTSWDKITLTVPDASLYCVLAVTMNVSLSGSFNDYGGQGSVPYSGTYELPLWNAWFNGPDLTNPSNVRRSPYFYFWAPGSGTSIDVSAAGFGPFNVYYAQLAPGPYQRGKHKSIGSEVPIAQLRLTFENQLGNGPEYSPGALSQQIKYPYYAGVGSPDLDLGVSAMVPNIRLEVAGSYGVNAPDGDADFADIIEDIFKSGTMALETQLGEIHRGLNCGQLPGMVQQNGLVVLEPSSPRIPFYRPNKAGSPLIAFCIFRQVGAGLPGISDTAGNAWTLIYSDDQRAFWYCASALASTGNVVQFTADGGSQYNASAFIGEMDPDSNVLDAVTSANGTGGTASVSITVDAPCFILAMMFCENFPFGGQKIPIHWTEAFQIKESGFGQDDRVRSAWRYVSAPGTYTFSLQAGGTNSWAAAAIAFRPQDPVSYPKPLGNILDDASMQLCRKQCTANGLCGSLWMGSQKAASAYLKDLYQAMNAAPVWSGFKLKSIPMSEVSAVGNGVVYTSPTAAGPLADLNSEYDLIGDVTTVPVAVGRKAQVNAPNILQLQFPNRGSDYADVIAAEPETGAISLYGPRKASPQPLDCIQDPVIARMLLGIAVRRQNYIRNTYKFTLKAQWQLLEPMDLVTLTEPKLNMSKFPMRLTSIQENDKFELECEAEPFIYGMNAPTPLAVTTAAPYAPSLGVDPGNVNTPIIFEPVPRLSQLKNENELWLVVSGADPNYGGCAVFISTDGGSSYNLLGEILGNAITGVSTADWPAASDPDTTDDLAVDLTESLGSLASYQVSDEDNFLYPCYVAGGNASIPYELMTYAVATLTAANKYTLKATGGGTNKLRRAVFGAPAVGAGVDHPLGSRFAFLSPQGVGILKVPMDPKWIGQTLKFKFAAFNQYGAGLQSLSGLTAYSFTPAGTVGSVNPNNVNYTQTPADALSQVSATQIDMAAVTVDFPGGPVKYNARTFTIPDPGGTPIVYYVTIADPGYVGDVGSSPTLTAFCENTQAKVGQPRFTYIGSIQAQHSGFASDVVTPGGWPPQQIFLINGT